MDIAQEKQDRQFQRDAIAAIFRAAPLEEIDHDRLAQITPHYQQRISECRRQLKMHIANVRVCIALENGTLKRLDGNYRYHPNPPLGRDASEPVPRLWTTDGPFTELFTLKP